MPSPRAPGSGGAHSVHTSLWLGTSGPDTELSFFWALPPIHTFKPRRVLGPGLSRDVLADGVQEVGQQLLPQGGPLVREQLPGSFNDPSLRLVKHAEEATDVTHICHQQGTNRLIQSREARPASLREEATSPPSLRQGTREDDLKEERLLLALVSSAHCSGPVARHSITGRGPGRAELSPHGSQGAETPKHPPSPTSPPAVSTTSQKPIQL